MWYRTAKFAQRISLLGGVLGLAALLGGYAIYPLSPTATADAAEPVEAKVPDRAELEKAFEEKMSGATLVGYFTTRGNEEKQLKPERYEIAKVTKIRDDVWAFTVRITYGNKDEQLALPLPLEVKWAGDTPVITLTNMPVPGFGTFTSRVLIYGDEYAGTWSGADHGGHLFGRIERTKP